MGGGAIGAGAGRGATRGIGARVFAELGTGALERGARAAGAAAALAPWPAAKNALTRSTSSSVKLANAEPLPVTPAFVQMSTRILLSIFSSLANE